MLYYHYMNNAQMIAVSVLLACAVIIGAFGLFAIDRREEQGASGQRAVIEREIKEAAYCETDTDCEVIYAPCPFGCHAPVNKNEAERLENLMQSYESDCVYGCIQAPPVQCIEQKCVLDEPQPGGEQSNAANENGEEIYPVSLQAVREKEYDGRDLQLGETLAQTNNYTRYYATYQSGELTISGIMNIPAGEGHEFDARHTNFMAATAAFFMEAL